MAQTGTTIPPSGGLGKLQWSDLLKGLIKSCGGLIVGILIKTLQDKHFPSYTEIEPLLEAVVYFFVSYLGINAATNNVGQLFTKDKPVVTVAAEDVKKENLTRDNDIPTLPPKP